MDKIRVNAKNASGGSLQGFRLDHAVAEAIRAWNELRGQPQGQPGWQCNTPREGYYQNGADRQPGCANILIRHPSSPGLTVQRSNVSFITLVFMIFRGASVDDIKTNRSRFVEANMGSATFWL
jgi:hypothetical protein